MDVLITYSNTLDKYINCGYNDNLDKHPGGNTTMIDFECIVLMSKSGIDSESVHLQISCRLQLSGTRSVMA